MHIALKDREIQEEKQCSKIKGSYSYMEAQAEGL